MGTDGVSRPSPGSDGWADRIGMPAPGIAICRMPMARAARGDALLQLRTFLELVLTQ